MRACYSYISMSSITAADSTLMWGGSTHRELNWPWWIITLVVHSHRTPAKPRKGTRTPPDSQLEIRKSNCNRTFAKLSRLRPPALGETFITGPRSTQPPRTYTFIIAFLILRKGPILILRRDQKLEFLVQNLRANFCCFLLLWRGLNDIRLKPY